MCDTIAYSVRACVLFSPVSRDTDNNFIPYYYYISLKKKISGVMCARAECGNIRTRHPKHISHST